MLYNSFRIYNYSAVQFIDLVKHHPIPIKLQASFPNLLLDIGQVLAKLMNLQQPNQKNMSQLYKYSYKEEKLADTSDDFYPPKKPQDSNEATINTLLFSLHSKKTQLRSYQIQQAAIKDKQTELDLQADRLAIASDFLCKQAQDLALRQAEALQRKSDLQKELKDWREACDCLTEEAATSEEELRQKRNYVGALSTKEQQLRRQIKAKDNQNKAVKDYNLGLDLAIQKNDSTISKQKQSNDNLAKTATTLQTFAKSFKKNIAQKHKDISRGKFQTGQLQNLITTRQFEKSNLMKEIDQRNWESNMYSHHNQQIEQTNLKLKGDLDKLILHFNSLKKNNAYLNGSVKEYAATGIETAKKILAQANK